MFLLLRVKEREGALVYALLSFGEVIIGSLPDIVDLLLRNYHESAL